MNREEILTFIKHALWELELIDDSNAVDETTHLEDIFLDSMSVLEFSTTLERNLKIRISEDEIGQFRHLHVGRMIDFIEEALTQKVARLQAPVT